jgi:hypothetical protein
MELLDFVVAEWRIRDGGESVCNEGKPTGRRIAQRCSCSPFDSADQKVGGCARPGLYPTWALKACAGLKTSSQET